jgi:hypothetical protein
MKLKNFYIMAFFILSMGIFIELYSIKQIGFYFVGMSGGMFFSSWFNMKEDDKDGR